MPPGRGGGFGGERLAGACKTILVVKEFPFRVAVTALTVEKEIAPALMLKVAAAAPAGTTAKAGTLRIWLELRSETGMPPSGAASVNVIVQVAALSEVKRSGAQLKEETAAAGAIAILHAA
jgi:hypothetical protein